MLIQATQVHETVQKYCGKVQPCEQGAQTLQTTDTRTARVNITSYVRLIKWCILNGRLFKKPAAWHIIAHFPSSGGARHGLHYAIWLISIHTDQYSASTTRCSSSSWREGVRRRLLSCTNSPVQRPMQHYELKANAYAHDEFTYECRSTVCWFVQQVTKGV